MRESSTSIGKESCEERESKKNHKRVISDRGERASGSIVLQNLLM